MSALLSRAAMALAGCCLGRRRRDWAAAMQAEYDAAVADGRALLFASGCLIAAWRELPVHLGGRQLLARHVLASCLIVPAAAVLLLAAADPFASGHAGAFASLLGGAFLNDGNRATVPVLAQLLAAIAAMRLAVAWAVLDRDWARVAAVERLSAAATIALAVLAALAFFNMRCAALPALALVAEAAAVAALARLHDKPVFG